MCPDWAVPSGHAVPVSEAVSAAAAVVVAVVVVWGHQRGAAESSYSRGLTVDMRRHRQEYMHGLSLPTIACANLRVMKAYRRDFTSEVCFCFPWAVNKRLNDAHI